MYKTRRLHATMLGLGTMLAATFGNPAVTLAQTEISTHTASDATVGDQFGQSVAISGSTAIVGAHREGSGIEPNDQGSAYVFVNSGGWTQQGLPLRAPTLDRHPGDQFGYSVAVDGDTAVVGAPFEASAGAAYVFVRSGTTWTLQQKLSSSLPSPGNRFGDSVAIQGTRIIVGASQQSNGGTGRAFVFTFNGSMWMQTFMFAPSSLDAGDQFGLSVALSNNTAVIGTRNDNDAGSAGSPHFGAAYVFLFNGTTWVSQGVLRAADKADGDQFGYSVAIKDDRIVVGAPMDDLDTGAPPLANAGAVYVFDRSGGVWTQSAKVRSADTVGGNQLGFSVGVDGDRLVAGANLGASPSGYVAIFQRSGSAWLEDTGELSVTPDFGDSGFGTSVAIEGTIFVGGAPGSQNILDGEAGTATFYQIDPLPPAGDTDGDGLNDADEIFLANGGPCPDLSNPDTDGDGLSDGYENDFGPNICDPDSDDDGLNDGAEVLTHMTNPVVADSDGDGLSDGAEINTHNTNPNDSDSDNDGLNDGEEVNTYSTNPVSDDSDNDGLTDLVESAAGCPLPTNCDSDGDTVPDGFEVSNGWDPCDADTDGDTLSDAEEFNLHGTDPTDSDSDDDNLDDGSEVDAAAGGTCPDPNNDDSDGDGIVDGNEVVGTCGPCDTDDDNDGLCNAAELLAGTSPTNPDSDDDDLLDGAEIASQCTDPLDPDTDGDTLLDGEEITTNPCDADTDNDTLEDNIDPHPTTLDSAQTVLAVMTYVVSGAVADTPVDEFLGPNMNVSRVRCTIMSAQLLLAAIAIDTGNYSTAHDLLTLSLARVDGISPPADWMREGCDKDMIREDIECLLILLDLID